MIISLTTIPSRIHLIEKTIDSLLVQEVPVYLWIPSFTKKTNTPFTYEEIPSWLLAKKGLTIEIVEDLGSITKIIPALERKVSDSIVTVDDDCIYPPHFIAQFRHWMEIYQNEKCLCYRGKVLTTGNYRTSISMRNVKSPRVVDIVTGVYGVAYRTDWFEVDELVDLSKAYPGNDDIILSGYLDKKGIERVAIPFAPGETVHEEREIGHIDSLWWAGNKHSNRNNLALKAMGLATFPKTIFGRLFFWKNPFLIPVKVGKSSRRNLA